MHNFWKTIKKPFFGLAPMADVTDAAFREMFVRCGGPDVYWTEFVSADGLCSKGRENLLIDFSFKNENPIIAQIFSSNHDNIYKAGLLAKDLGFHGLDINMGCPDKSIEKQGCGAALIKNPNQAIKIIEYAKKVGLPLSIKSRLGYSSVDYEWIKILLSTHIDALTFHLRTRNEMSNVAARWEEMKKIIDLRNKISPNTLIIGNGDIVSLSNAEQMIEKYKCDGVMIGRGAFGNPMFFNKSIKIENLLIKERLNIMKEHTEIFEKKFSVVKNMNIMKKHYKAYTKDIPNIQNLRLILMEAKSYKDIYMAIDEFIKKL